MSDKPTGHLAVAEAYALACFNVLNKHLEGTPRCGCLVEDGASFPAFQINTQCLLGMNALEEYETAAARVRALKFPTT